MTVERILKTGYLPKELPPPFKSTTFGDFVAAGVPATFLLKPKGGFKARPAIHNLARSGTLRRRLSIPNPVNMYQVAQAVFDGWSTLVSRTSLSAISLTAPKMMPTGRAIRPKHNFKYLPIARATSRSGARYILRADINSFYPSIYTHSIPWALHTKPIAKANTSIKLLGNRLDVAIRNGQSGQTMGIPIGPDTSLVIAETVLAAIDEKIGQLGPGWRYIDDMEFAFQNYAEAERALASLQELVSDFELQLNPRKCEIVELPAPLEAFWVPHLRLFQFRSRTNQQHYDLLGYFGRAFELAADHRSEAILRYAVSTTKNQIIAKSNWPLYESLLLQCIAIEPGTAQRVVEELYRYSQRQTLDRKKIGDTLEQVIEAHAPLGHGSEVAWALWAAIILNISLSDATANLTGNMQDNVVALLALDAQARGLIAPTIPFDKWRALMIADELESENWLLAYEAFVHGWLPSFAGGDYLATHPLFAPMQAADVRFYDPSAPLLTPLSPTAILKPGPALQQAKTPTDSTLQEPAQVAATPSAAADSDSTGYEADAGEPEEYDDDDEENSEDVSG